MCKTMSSLERGCFLENLKVMKDSKPSSLCSFGGLNGNIMKDKKLISTGIGILILPGDNTKISLHTYIPALLTRKHLDSLAKFIISSLFHADRNKNDAHVFDILKTAFKVSLL